MVGTATTNITDSEVNKNHLAVYEVPSRGCKVGVWCVVSALKVMEPVLFRRNSFSPLTLIVTQLLRFFKESNSAQNFNNFRKEVINSSKKERRCMSINIFRRREVGLAAAGPLTTRCNIKFFNRAHMCVL